MEESVIINFYRGPESHYSYLLPTPTEDHKGGIFFAEDTHKLYLDGEQYGGDGEARVIDVQLDDDKNLIIYYDDGTTESIPMKVTTSSVLTEEIVISGGPWASVVSSAFGSKVPSNITFQDFLEKLLRKEIWPTPGYITGSYSVSAGSPSISVSGATSGGLALVGTQVTVSGSTAKSVSYSSAVSKITGMTNGYSETIDGTVYANTSVSATGWTISQKEGTVYKLSRTTTGFGGEGAASSSSESASTCSLEGVTLKVALGSNTVKVTQTSPSMIGSAGGIETQYYYLSSFMNRDESHKTRVIAAQTDVVKTPSSTTSSTFSVTGVKPCYTNISGTSLLTDTSVQIGLTTSSTFSWSVPSEVANNQHFMFEYPATHTVTSFKVKDLQGNYVDYTGSYNSISSTKKREINGVSYDYNVFSITGALQGEMDCKLTLNKGLSS